MPDAFSGPCIRVLLASKKTNLINISQTDLVGGRQRGVMSLLLAYAACTKAELIARSYIILRGKRRGVPFHLEATRSYLGIRKRAPNIVSPMQGRAIVLLYKGRFGKRVDRCPGKLANYDEPRVTSCRQIGTWTLVPQ